MSDEWDLGSGPCDEPCAQLGHTPNFAAVNRLEVLAYAAALTALHGPPPEGIQLTCKSNPHDFGTYRTLVAIVADDAPEPDTVAAYLTRLEAGIGCWHEAGFTAPAQYGNHGQLVAPPRTLAETIVAAIKTTRPNADGTFPIPAFATLHTNLQRAFPEHAERAAQELAATGPQ